MVQWNPFLDTGTATAYADSRPDHHSSAVAAAVRLFSLCTPIPLVVDVGCGTGMSSRAFAAAATTVLGVDPSRPMLTAGAPHTRVQASAERLPIRDGVVDLVTAAAAFHWFDQPVALREIVRALRPGGAVAVYTDFFSGRLRGADDATAWLADVYRPHFPAPARPVLGPGDRRGRRAQIRRRTAVGARRAHDPGAPDQISHEPEQRDQRHGRRPHHGAGAAQLAAPGAE